VSPANQKRSGPIICTFYPSRFLPEIRVASHPSAFKVKKFAPNKPNFKTHLKTVA
jgi:hypothetical protein